MEHERAFVTKWSIPDQRWDKAREAVAQHAAQSDYDRHPLGRYNLLYGNLDFAYAGPRVYGVNLSLMDLGLALADAYVKEAFVPGCTTTYEHRRPGPSASSTALRSVRPASRHQQLRDHRSDRSLYLMVREPDRLDPDERAREKQRSREEDVRALASGEKSRDELRRENGHFAFRNVA
jgi:hypothetical protein